MSIEPGERRRRRDLERAREASAAQAATPGADQSSPSALATPAAGPTAERPAAAEVDLSRLTRRELRELEAQRSAQTSAQGTGTSAQSPAAAPAPAEAA